MPHEHVLTIRNGEYRCKTRSCYYTIAMPDGVREAYERDTAAKLSQNAVAALEAWSAQMPTADLVALVRLSRIELARRGDLHAIG